MPTLEWASCGGSHCVIVPFRVLCAIRTWLQSLRWFCCMLLFVQLLPYRASSFCKHEIAAFSWLNAEPLKTVNPLVGRLVRYSIHGRSFTRLHLGGETNHWTEVGQLDWASLIPRSSCPHFLITWRMPNWSCIFYFFVFYCTLITLILCVEWCDLPYCVYVHACLC